MAISNKDLELALNEAEDVVSSMNVVIYRLAELELSDLSEDKRRLEIGYIRETTNSVKARVVKILDIIK